MKTNKSAKLFKTGETVVIVGSSTFDREMVIYKDPISFVQTIANSKENEPMTNQQFMLNVSTLLKEVDMVIPHHNEEAFLMALIKAGICSSATLN